MMLASVVNMTYRRLISCVWSTLQREQTISILPTASALKNFFGQNLHFTHSIREVGAGSRQLVLTLA